LILRRSWNLAQEVLPAQHGPPPSEHATIRFAPKTKIEIAEDALTEPVIEAMIGSAHTGNVGALQFRT